MRPFVVDALVLTGVGVVLGIGGSRLAVDAPMRMIGTELPPWLGVHIDGAVLISSAALAVVVALAVAVLPALQGLRTDVERQLRQEAGRLAGRRAQQGARRWLVGIRAAMASVLLVAAGIFAMGLTQLPQRHPGFATDHVLTFRVDPPYGRYPDTATTSEFYRGASERLAAIPGVHAVGANTNQPLAALDVPSSRVVVEGGESGRSDESPFVNFQIVGGDYSGAMAILLVRGRVFTLDDDPTSPLVAVISERTARRLRIAWNQDGIRSGATAAVWLTIVGVVGSVRFAGVHDEGGLDVYTPHRQMFVGDSHMVLSTVVASETIASEVRAAIDAVDPEQSFFDVRTVDRRLKDTVWRQRVSTAVLSLFAVISLVPAVIGTYAVTARAGASRHRYGAGWGRGGRSNPGRRARHVDPDDGLALALPAVLAAAAAVACYLPVRRVVRSLALSDTLR